MRMAKKETTSEGTPICPKHELAMVRRKSRFGEFWGCPKYPACRVTHKIMSESMQSKIKQSATLF